MPFISLSKSQGVRYLGVLLANKPNPCDTFDFIVSKLRKRIQCFASRFYSFETRLVVLRYLLQAKLPFSLALVRLRTADLKALERLLASFLWGQGPDGRNKIVLISWDKLALPLELGGTGVWCIRAFQKSLLTKLLLNSLGFEDSLWGALFWSSLPRTSLLVGSRFLIFEEFTDWSFSLVAWTFYPLEWRLLSPISSDMYIFPFEVSEVHSLFREEQAAVVLPSLSVRWSLDSTLHDWLALFGKLWAAGAHRRDGLFLWRILLKGFFTGARASLIGVSTVNCRFCNLHMEDITHLFFMCPCKTRDWMILAYTFPFLRPLILMLLAGEAFPSILRSALFFPKGLWLFTVALFSTFLRTIWKQRCTYVYEDSFQHIPLQLTLALLGEKLVGQYIVAGRAVEKFWHLRYTRL
ncbi:hypothetical protein R1sor_020301 [Riccia sorocarpa]|uniref:Reverse transcriptase zinc-binding domain-containing protein n=1 Tax=Riccia sorocarpa TaxID=122646 RepID=A0ABD3IGM3_9MARC